MCPHLASSHLPNCRCPCSGSSQRSVPYVCHLVMLNELTARPEMHIHLALIVPSESLFLRDQVAVVEFVFSNVIAKCLAKSRFLSTYRLKELQSKAIRINSTVETSDSMDHTKQSYTRCPVSDFGIGDLVRCIISGQPPLPPGSLIRRIEGFSICIGTNTGESPFYVTGKDRRRCSS